MRLLAFTGVEGRLQRRDDLREEIVPGARGRRSTLGEHALLILGEGVGREPSLGAQIVAICDHFRGVGKALGRLLVQRQPLEFEESQRVGRFDVAALDLGVQVTGVRIRDVHRLAQVGIGPIARKTPIEFCQAGQGDGKSRAVKGRDGPPVGRREGTTLLESGRDLGHRRCGVRGERGEVPVNATGVGGSCHWTTLASARIDSTLAIGSGGVPVSPRRNGPSGL